MTTLDTIKSLVSLTNGIRLHTDEEFADFMGGVATLDLLHECDDYRFSEGVHDDGRRFFTITGVTSGDTIVSFRTIQAHESPRLALA